VVCLICFVYLVGRTGKPNRRTGSSGWSCLSGLSGWSGFWGKRAGRARRAGLATRRTGWRGLFRLSGAPREKPGSRIVRKQTMKECNADPKECNNRSLITLFSVVLHSFATGQRVPDRDRQRDHQGGPGAKREGNPLLPPFPAGNHPAPPQGCLWVSRT
jgi:hypothetical protein